MGNLKIQDYNSIYDEFKEIERQIHYLENFTALRDVQSMFENTLKIIRLKFKRTELGWKLAKFYV